MRDALRWMWWLPLFVTWSTAVGASPFAYVTSSNNTVSVIDTATNAVVATVPAGRGAAGVAVHPLGVRVYVTNQEDNTISVIDTSNNAVIATIDLPVTPVPLTQHSRIGSGPEPTWTPTPAPAKPLGSAPLGIAPDPSGTYVYVATVGELLVVDSRTNGVIDGVRLPMARTNEPRSVAPSPNGALVYAGYNARNSAGILESGTVFAIDAATRQIVAMVDLEPVYAFAIDSTGTHLYVSTNGLGSGGHLSVLDTSTLAPSDIPIGQVPAAAGVAVAPNGQRVYVAAGNVLVYDVVQQRLVDTIPVSGAASVALTPDGQRLYATNVRDNSVSVIDLANDSVVMTIPVGSGPVAFGQFIGPAIIGGTPTPTLAVPPGECGEVCDGRPCFGGFCVAQGSNGCACEGPTFTATASATVTPTPTRTPSETGCGPGNAVTCTPTALPSPTASHTQPVSNKPTATVTPLPRGDSGGCSMSEREHESKFLICMGTLAALLFSHRLVSFRKTER